eukprot:CAMPEP_0168530186 /NCGR_PEP_ID=MMETSP0405-20121227/14482_1 /TAXON_ID=498012 /ORGANISM="Trichosphaerium sp, Strain Am-I-7 wt" /LENGTH=461 /DNA_ID=CAMNT_0008554309 /DNA_START=766 /DNA_END=2151 /DNA_ORIENTATION=-
MPWFLYIWPQFALARGIFLMNDGCSTLFTCYGPLWSMGWPNELWTCIIALYISAIVYYVLFLYLDQVLPKKFGVPRHPLFCFPTSVQCGKKVFKQGEEAPLLRTDGAGNRDTDVVMEAKKVSSGDYDSAYPLVIQNLTKIYAAKPPKRALNNMSLAVPEGECFGLLGENGAGKTTMLSILTGLYQPTSGLAWVGGFDIRNNIDKVQRVMGMCPQFDILWDDLTVTEHILFYSRLRGYPPKKEKSHTEQLLRDVGLFRFKNRLSKKLSGGMKRRLSIAIALAGSSRIVFLDEPTTGLDPTSRRQIWKIIQRAKRGRAIMLTTHSMEEAETLCTRIGVLAYGNLRCLGNQTHLKNKFATGYIIKINFDIKQKKKASDFVRKVLPNAVLVGDFSCTETHHIYEKIKVSAIFAKMEAESSDNGIVDWSLSQLGLDDVFQKVVADSRKERDKQEEHTDDVQVVLTV